MASFCRTGTASIVLIIRKDPTGKEVFQRNMVICWIVTFFRYVLEEFTGTVIGFEIKQVETRNRFIPIFFSPPSIASIPNMDGCQNSLGCRWNEWMNNKKKEWFDVWCYLKNANSTWNRKEQIKLFVARKKNSDDFYGKIESYYRHIISIQ